MLENKGPTQEMTEVQRFREERKTVVTLLLSEHWKSIVLSSDVEGSTRRVDFVNWSLDDHKQARNWARVGADLKIPDKMKCLL